MIIEKFEENKIVFAYDEWNRKDVDDDNYYVVAYLELYPTRLALRYRKADFTCDSRGWLVGDFVETEKDKPSKITIGLNIDNIDSTLYYSGHIIMDFISKRIASYDMACLPFKKKISAQRAEDIRVRHLAKFFNRTFSDIYNGYLDMADQRCRMDIYEKAFFSVGGKAHYEKFVKNNENIVPDFYLGKDILKYRAAAMAFMNAMWEYRPNQIACPIGESQTSMIMPSKWNWRSHMVLSTNHLSTGTNKFLDNFPGCVPTDMKLAYNTTRKPSRLFLIAQDALRQKCAHPYHRGVDDPEQAFKILEKSSDEQIKKALRLVGVSYTRKSSKVADGLGYIFDYDPLDYNCTIVGWARNSIEAHQQENARSLEEKLKPYSDSIEIAPEFPIDFSNYGIKQLRTPREIVLEGHEMQHCVGSYVKKALKGLSYIFSFEAEKDRATAEINKFGRVVQVKGVRNSNNRATAEMSKILKREISSAIEKKEYNPPKENMQYCGEEVIPFF